jgi:hypothetical protein
MNGLLPDFYKHACDELLEFVRWRKLHSAQYLNTLNARKNGKAKFSSADPNFYADFSTESCE